MKLTPDEIVSNERYRLISSLEYKEVAEFVFSHMKTRNPVIILFWSLSLAALIWTVALRIAISAELTVVKLLPWSLAGLILLPLILIPVHEALHIVVFWLLGGKDIRIGADIRNFVVYVTAHRHVVGPRSFLTIAFFPFVMITAAHLYSISVAEVHWQWSLSLSLLAHTTMCAGDFSMGGFYYSNRDKRILTWDDADKRIAYFYDDSGDNFKGTEDSRFMDNK